jgi:nucleoid-associated protein YgaU
MAWLMQGNVAPHVGRRKHMFDSGLDTERTFGHHRAMRRTYVRRRRTVAAVTTALVAVLLSPLAAGAVRRGEAPDPPAPRPVQQVVVREGDTLWSIARQVRPDADPRATVAAIVSANGVDPGALVPGRSLVVPLA